MVVVSGTRAAALPFEELARRTGAYCWLETRLFQALGDWVATVPEPDVKVVLAGHAQEHAWHAELWQERLPLAPEMDPDRLTAPGEELSAFATALVEPEGEDHTIEKLVGAYRVLLPRLIVAYSQHLRATTEVTDGPTIRALRLVLRDDLDGWARGEELLQSLLSGEAEVRRAADRQARLEAMLGAANLVLPVSHGGRTGNLDSGGKV